MLEGRVAIVTGGANGVGRATVKALAGAGADVAICDFDVARLRSVAEEVEAGGRKALQENIDLTRWDQVQAMADRVGSTFGRIDILAAVAGGSGITSTYQTRDTETGSYAYNEEGLKQRWTEEIEEEDWDGTLDLNLKAVFLCCKAVIPWMKRQGSGAIVTFSSIGASMGMPSSTFAYAAYAAAKAGVEGLTRQLARELGPFGVRANCISPGMIASERLETRRRRQRETLEAEGREMPSLTGALNPLGRLSTLDEQAKVVLFLASDDSSYINGVRLDVNGGTYMR